MFDLFTVFHDQLVYVKKKIENANLQSLGCKTGDEKAIAAGSFEEFAKAGDR